MSDADEVEPYENTLDAPELRREVRDAWDDWAAISKDLRDLPEVPSLRTLGAFINSSLWLDFGHAHEIAIKMQRQYGLEAIPPKSEYETAAAHYNFIRDAVMEKLARDAEANAE